MSLYLAEENKRLCWCGNPTTYGWRPECVIHAPRAPEETRKMTTAVAEAHKHREWVATKAKTYRNDGVELPEPFRRLEDLASLVLAEPSPAAGPAPDERLARALAMLQEIADVVNASH